MRKILFLDIDGVLNTEQQQWKCQMEDVPPTDKFGFRLSDLRLPSGLTEIKRETFTSCDGIKCMIIPEGVRKVGDSAIRLCESMEFLLIPSTLEMVSFGGFGQCHKLKQVQCYSRNPNGISMGSAFLDMDLTRCELQVPKGMEQVYRNHPVFGLFGVIEGVL